MILEVKDIHTYYGTSHILFGVSLEESEGDAVALLGRNGAGKTTTLRSIMGLTPPRSGSVRFRGKEIQGKPSYFVAQQGIGYVPDERLIFPDLTVWENLDIGARKASGRGMEWTLDRVFELFPILKEMQNRPGGTLSGGEQQMLTIARSLMTNPQLLILDEPAEGLAPLVVKALKEQVLILKEKEITLLLSEQNVKFAMDTCDRAYVIEKGTIRYQGSIEELKQNEEVRKRYLMI